MRVEGVVQGVGFRPYVHGLAHRLGLSGRVGNDTAGVFVEIEGAEQAVSEFLATLLPTFTELEERAGDTLYVDGAARLMSDDASLL